MGVEKTVTSHILWQSLLSASNIKLFWKDVERRFLGASQSFLDYNGFKSINDILGKTDEDIGWHIDPYPYMNDEYQVIQTGCTIQNSNGKCIIKGQVRHIQATKMPLRNEDGKIIGLIGYFMDVTDVKNNTDMLLSHANTDQLTGLVNRRGLMQAFDEYIAEYEKRIWILQSCSWISITLRRSMIPTDML